MISTEQNTSESYDAEYYRAACGAIPYERSEHWLNFFALIADEIIRSLQPRRVLDAGCAKGFLVEAFWDRGVYCEGIDISEYAISEVRPDIREYCSVGSIAANHLGKFDVVTCIEVLEHLPPELARTAVGNLCAAADTILFSSTPTDFDEPTHLNVRPPIYWLQLFSEFGFSPDARFDASFVAPHAILFRNGTAHGDDFLRLFAEYIRYKTGFEAQNAGLRDMRCQLADAAAGAEAKQKANQAEIVRLQQRVSNAENEMGRLRAELANVSVALAERTASYETLRGKLDAARSALDQSREWAASLQRELDREQGARQQFALSLDEKDTEIQSLEQKLLSDAQALELKLSASNQESDRLRAEVSCVESDRAAVQATLDAVLSSRAWRLAERTRIPIRRLQHRWPLLFRVARLFARKLLGPRTQPPQPAPSPASTTETDPSASAKSNDIAESSESIPASPPCIDPDYQRWMDEYEPRAVDLHRQREQARALSRRPLFSIIVPVYRVTPSVLRDCINSVLDQTYDNWELSIAHAADGDSANLQYLQELARRESRVRLAELEENKGISGNSNAALDLATGEFVAFLDHDDTLAPFALFEMASRLEQWPNLDLLYSDHDYLSPEYALRCNPLFKPDWSPEIMFSANYITHLTAVRRTLVDEVGGFDSATDGAQDWDLFLRVTERTTRIIHIPQILYHWRMHSESTARNDSAKNYAVTAQLLALSRHMERLGMDASPEVMPDGLLHTRFHHPPSGMVSIIIPTKDRVDLLSRCISSLLEVTRHPNFEILIVDNASTQLETREYLEKLQLDERIQVIWFPGLFNYGSVNNTAARAARGEFLLFLNNDVEITRPEWLTELSAWAKHRSVGVVGGKLLRPNGAIQHAGVVVGMNGFADHPFADLPALTFGIAGSTGWYRNFLAVTGACMMMRREVFDQLGGFDERFILCGSDVEICLRASAGGYRVVYNPFAELLHHEQQTRGDHVPASDYVESLKHYRRWLLAGDPYWNQNLSLWSKKPSFRHREEPDSLRFATQHAKAVTNTAVAAPNSTTHQPSEEEFLVSLFDCSVEDFTWLREHGNRLRGFYPLKRILWFIPAFENAYYGGILTILRFAEYWHRRKGTENLFAICSSTSRDVVAAKIRCIYPDLRDSDVFVLRSTEAAANIPAVDASICTLWITPYYALHHREAVRRFYLIQDFEPAFYKAGSASALAESTYRMGLYGIANTISLKRTYESEYGGKAIHFTPCIDETTFYPSKLRERRNPHGPWLVFMYGRPGHARNSFELLVSAAKELKQTLESRVRIVSAGSEWNPLDHGLEGIVENLGMLSYEDSARLYREADVGVVMMLTRHPSYIPMELMASGCLVVTNLNSWTSWLLKDNENCLLTCATATSVAETVRKGLLDASLRERITRTALELIRSQYLDWPSQMETVYEYMCDPERYLERQENADQLHNDEDFGDEGARVTQDVRERANSSA